MLTLAALTAVSVAQNSTTAPATTRPAAAAPSTSSAKSATDAKQGAPKLETPSAATTGSGSAPAHPAEPAHPKAAESLDLMSMVFVFMLASFIGLGVIMRVSRLLHTPLMSITNAISAIAVVGAILVAGHKGYPWYITLMGTVALFASMTNIVSGFLITDRMLKMFKSRGGAKA
ncbi:MAG: NAD(P) transhydrogenase subunit alpha [Phycisphaerales bacterium]|nr:NAD(P) transhydrogenase subunit alpha [Phycisphaerales bacterium]